MPLEHPIGYRVYGLAAIALGLVGLAFGDFASVWQPVPDGLPGRKILAYVVATAFLVAGGALQWRRTAQVAAVALTALYALGAVLLHGPRVTLHPLVFGAWAGLTEQIALVAGGLAAYGAVVPRGPAPKARIGEIGRIVFALCLIEFGVVHFVYPKETAAFVPKWIAPSQLFWAYATGAAHVAAGLAILTGVLDKLASKLLVLMFFGFTAFVHGPLIVSAPKEHMSWTANAINLALIGSAWAVADVVAARRRRGAALVTEAPQPA